MAFAKFKVKKGVRTITTTGDYEDAIPVGLIIPYTSSTPPSGWLMCDGTSTTGYTELAALVGSTTPNLSGNIIIGTNTSPGGATGNGTSGSGLVTGGTALTANSINSSASTTNTNGAVNLDHTHGMNSHTHTNPHTHNYDHTHNAYHYHGGGSHSHGVPSGGSPATAGDHAHSGRFGSSNQHGPGTQNRAAQTVNTTSVYQTNDGGHVHNVGNASVTLSSNGSFPNTPVATGTFSASPTTTTSPSTATTSSTGGSSTFSIEQPTMAVYYIIKY